MTGTDLKAYVRGLKGSQRHGDLVLISATKWLPNGSGNAKYLLVGRFCSNVLSKCLSDEDTKTICKLLGCKRLALYEKISADGFRTPRIRLIVGCDSIVIHQDVGVK